MKKLKPPKRIRNHVNPLSYNKEIFFDSFNNKNPIIIDIGSYRGEFGMKLLKKFKKEKEKRNFIFFEIRKPFLNFLINLFFDEKNVKIFGGDAGKNLENILKKSIEKNIKIEKIFINFPDPWFKKKHQKRRLVNSIFLKNLKKWIPRETKIIFQTDQKKLFFETKKIIKKSGFFKIEIFKKSIWGIKTYWEEMKEKEGKKIYRMSFFKKKPKKNFWSFFFNIF